MDLRQPDQSSHGSWNSQVSNEALSSWQQSPGLLGFAPLFRRWNQSDGLENLAQREPLSRSSRKVTLVSAMPRSTAAEGLLPWRATSACLQYAARTLGTRWQRFDKSRLSCGEKQASVPRRANESLGSGGILFWGRYFVVRRNETRVELLWFHIVLPRCDVK